MISFIPHKNKKHNLRTITFVLVVNFLSAAVAYFAVINPSFFETKIIVEKTGYFQSKQPLVINFSLPVIPSLVEKNIAIFPEQGVRMDWEKNKKLTIYPENIWLPETEYKLELKGKNIFLANFSSNINFETEPYPRTVSVSPINGATNVVLGIEDPLTFNFDKSLENYDLKFEVFPEKSLDFHLNKEKTAVELLAQNNFELSTRYTVAAYLKTKEQSEDSYHKVGEIAFSTITPPVERSKDPAIRMQEAMLYTKPQILTGKYIDISLKHQNMVIFENGKALDAFMISTGKKGMETPEGTFSIHNKAPRVWSKKYELFMPYWMAFLPSGQMGIHELPEWPGGFKEGANHLGIPVSHGCVRLGIGSAKRVYEWAEIGITVIVHG